jgi:Kef-type K+ transport system membrane component KefB
MASLETLSTVGLILFLFLIGTEVEVEHLYHLRATATLSSMMSIVAPFLMAALLAHSLRIRFAPPGIGSAPFILFLGIAMSITAFPVLARILEERGIQGARLGTTAILCAAVDDVVAWVLLALALALIGPGGGSLSLVVRLVGLALYLSVMIGVIRPVAARLLRLRRKSDLSIELLQRMLSDSIRCSEHSWPGYVFRARLPCGKRYAGGSRCWSPFCCCHFSLPSQACARASIC